MSPKSYLRRLKHRIIFYSFLLGNLSKKKFECPVCCYQGPFLNLNTPFGLRKHAKCPNCGALERHRIQYLVTNSILNNRDLSMLKMLHFAPEPFFRNFFSKRFSQYKTADLNMPEVDYCVDLQDLPFKAQSYDFVFASHVLEHIPDDGKAISEIRRILKPNGVAILPVPLVAEKTIEYPEPNPNDGYHTRAPGFDYFERFNRHFSKVEKYSSDVFPTKHQVYIYEDRTKWPIKECPLRPSMEGDKHVIIIPVCYV